MKEVPDHEAQGAAPILLARHREPACCHWPHAHLVLSLSCWALISFSLGWPLCISCRAIWFTTATREAWLFISGSRLSNLQRQLDRAVTCLVTEAAQGGRVGGLGDPMAAAHLCWMTSRSSSFSGICMLLSHCSFSSIQSSQASASLNILYRARVSCSACFRSRVSSATSL